MFVIGPPEPAVRALVQQLFDGDNLPEHLLEQAAMRCSHRNNKLIYGKPTDYRSEELYPIEELMKRQDCPAVQPFLKGYLMRDVGLRAVVLSMLEPNPSKELQQNAVQGYARGYAICFRVIGEQADHVKSLLLRMVGLWLGDHPNDQEALLVKYHTESAQRGDKWLIAKLLGLVPRLDAWYKARVLACVADLQFENQEFLGALKHAEASLQLMPNHLDMLYIKAFSMQVVASGRLSGGGSIQSANSSLEPAFAAFELYLATAPDAHPLKPKGHISLGLLHLIDADMNRVKARSQETDALKLKALMAEAIRSSNAAAEKCLAGGYAARRKVPVLFAGGYPWSDGLPNAVKALIAQSRATLQDLEALIGRAEGASGQPKPAVTSNRVGSSNSSSRGGGGGSGSPSGGGKSGGRRNQASSTDEGLVATASSSRSNKASSSSGSGVRSKQQAVLSCNACGTTAAASESGRLLRCAACKSLRYCSAECQQLDWKAHKTLCKQLRSRSPA